MHVVLIYSGGLDSTVLLYDLLAQQVDVEALSIAYGQRHARELQSATRICATQRIRHHTLNLGALSSVFRGSSQTDATVPVPHGHYADESMKATVVPNRNMVLLALAMAHAISNGAEAVAYAAHSGDHAIYPDCRPAFVRAMQQAAQLCDWHPLQLWAPYLEWTKGEIVCQGDILGVPFAETWSCYDPQDADGIIVHCGLCGTCVERQEAFVLAGVSDQTEYADASWVSRL